VLFYDRRLSRDNSVSCSSCHRQEHGFADNRQFSAGHLGVPTTRNSQSVLHTRTYQSSKQLFWDGKVSGLRAAVVAPISHPDEMGFSLREVVVKIQHEPYYQALSYNAYNSIYLDPARIAECLEDFIESLPSFNSRWDMESKNSFRGFTSEENLGRSIFSSRCNTCHPSGAFSNGSFMNNGLDLVSADPGLGGITLKETDMGKFRVPSLRDVAVTAPYMHDGRFRTLREVIDHYSNGTQAHPNRSTALGSPMNLSEQHKLALEAFLRTLTDEQSANNPAFSDPFRNEYGRPKEGEKQ
jgi:cytochrome c peroxidase